MSKNTLAVLIPDSLKALLSKGELTERYYNPGNVFERVLMVSTYDVVAPDIKSADLQRFVGQAECELLQYPSPPFKATLGWHPQMMQKWVSDFIKILEKSNVSMIRCHGSHLNSLLAMHSKQALNIPYVVSLHINPDEDILKRSPGIKQTIINKRVRQIQKKTLRSADLVLPVYKPIVPFLESLNVRKYQVAYNVISPDNLVRKMRYSVGERKRIISVGRLIKEKNPAYIIEAIKDRSDIDLTIVGDGDLYSELEVLIRSYKMANRVRMIKSMPNRELCRSLVTYDLFVVHSEYWEISKAVLEALLCGMPVIINERTGLPVPEFENEIVQLVKTNSDAYRQAIERLLADEDLRRALGERAYQFAQDNWHPRITEQKYAEIYRSLKRT